MEQATGRFIRNFKTLCDNAQSEDDIKMACNIFFNDIARAFNINIDRANEKISVHGGRIDSIYNNIYFEYKKLNLFKTNEGVKEAVYGRKAGNDHGLYHYLINFSLEQCGGFETGFVDCLLNNVGVGFDGKKFVFCRFVKSETAKNLYDAKKTINFPATVSHVQNVDFYQSEPVDFEIGVKRILLYIRSTRKKRLTAENLCKAFSTKSNITQRTIPYLYKLLSRSLASNTRIETLYNEWDRIFGTIYEKQETDFVKHASAISRIYEIGNTETDIDVKKSLFCIQTYYSIIIKILIQNLFVSLRLPQMRSAVLRDKSDLIGLFHGTRDNFNDYVDNFFEINFFEWFTLAENIELSYLNDIITVIDDFETTASVIKPETVGDVLKQTYESIMPKELRHLMGEYYTPEWLVDFTIEHTGYKCGLEETVLDPTCGSGVFLTHLIKKYKEKYSDNLSYNELVQHIVSNFVGFDINPIAVIQGKGNYILSIGDITELKQPVSIPIYMCDSILVPTVHAKQEKGEKSVKIETSIGTFNLPLLENRRESDSFLKTMSKCILQDYTVYEQFEKRIKKELGITLSPDTEALARTLFCQLIDLHLAGKDGFWPVILKNTFAPLFSKQQFDYLMGNPPWIAWKAMSESYRKLTLDIWLSYGIFEKNAYDKITSHDDFAMAVTYVSIDHYLKSHGVAGLILPQTFVKSLKGGEGFRKLCVTRDGQKTPFSIEEVYDMLAVNPFKGIASNKTSVYFFRKSVEMTYPMNNYFECSIRNGETVSYTQPYEEVREKLEYERKSAKPINKDDIRSPWLTLDANVMAHLDFYLGNSVYKARKGIEPCGAKGVYLIKVLGERNGKVLISNLIERSRLAEAKSKGVHRGYVDKDFVYPMVGGRNIDKWGINSNLFMLVPHNNSGEGIYRGVDEAVMKEQFFSTYDWLYYFHDLLLETRIRSAKFFDEKQFPWYRLDNVGEYTFAPYKVLWQEQARQMKCCVISTLDNEFLGDKTVVTDSKVLYVSLNNETEAHYLCGVLNSKTIEEIVQGYTINTNRGTDIVKTIRIPKFDSANKGHLAIASLSKSAHRCYLEKDSFDIAKIENEINKMIKKLFEQ